MTGNGKQPGRMRHLPSLKMSSYKANSTFACVLISRVLL
jgi:hypothetical protein